MTKIKKPNKVYFHRQPIWVDQQWSWSITFSNGEKFWPAYSETFAKKADMLHNLALIHGRELAAGDTVINGRQHAAWRWDLDAALAEAGILKPSPETYTSKEEVS